MTDDEHARWRERSMAHAAALRAALGRDALTGPELRECDRKAAVEVIGEPAGVTLGQGA